MPSAATAVMFFGEQCGRAREAIELYASVIPSAEVVSITDVTDPAMGNVGDVLRSEMLVGGARLILFDNGYDHAFAITPAISLWLDLGSDDELRAVHDALVDGGQALMPLGDYGFSKRFGWVQDRFGVTWQLNLPHS